MRECLVRFRHAVHVFLLLHRPAARIGRIINSSASLSTIVLPARSANTAAASESPAIACGTDSLPPEPGSSRRPRAAFSLPATLHVLDGLLENFQRIVVVFFAT